MILKASKTYNSLNQNIVVLSFDPFIPRLAECAGQLSQAEKDREHWKLESQLAAIKINKLNSQVGYLYKELSYSITHITSTYLRFS